MRRGAVRCPPYSREYQKMPNAISYRWTGLSDLGRATTWCNNLPAARLEALNLQALLVLVSAVHDEGLSLCREVWDPSTGEVPVEVEDAFLSTAAGCHDALLLCAAAARRAAPDCIQPPPSRPLSVATLATHLNASEAHAPLPQDVASALLELEWVRQMAVAEHFGPRQREERALAPVNPSTLEGLLVAVGVVIVCVKSGLPWIHLP